MKQWKRILSYLFEIHVETTSSEYNEALHVSISRGRYQLSTQNAIYSFGDLYTNFYEAFKRINLEERNVEKVLILGFGLGSIPLMLETHFDKKYHYTAVEIDEEVLYLANKYVTHELESPIEMVCTDAEFFVQQCAENYDLICVDIFLDDVIPDQFQKQAFLKDIRSLIAPKGVLLYNRLAFTKVDKSTNKRFFENEFLPIFPKGDYLDVDGNWMYVNERVAS